MSPLGKPQMSMVTVAVLAMPNLGNSVAKGIQRIAGVMIGELVGVDMGHIVNGRTFAANELAKPGLLLL